MKKSLFFLYVLISTICFSQVGIGTSTPNNKSILDIESKTTGVLMPRLTGAERDAIDPESSSDPSGVDGLLIYNTDTDCYNYWNRATLSWVSMCQSTATCDPSTWSEANINCNQYPSADSNTYNVGTSTTGYAITSSVNVTKIGPYSLSIVSNNGVTYSTTGTFNVLGMQNITLTSNGGAPTSSPINFIVKSNGASVCNYTKSATTPLTYSTACSPSTPNTNTFLFTQGNPSSGTFTIPLSVSGTGDIPAFTGTQSGITLTTNTIIGATSGNTTLTVTISGTPTTSGVINVPLTINGVTCTYTFNVNNANAAFTCTGSVTSGNYIVATNLTTNEIITVNLNVTTPGKVRLISQDKNGIFFDSGEVIVATGSQTIIMNASVASSGKYPMTSEEVSNGANGANNQTATYSITNTLTNTTLSCNATIDVKPRLWTNTYSSSGNRALINGANTTNDHLQMNMQDQSTYQSLGIANYFKVWVKNMSATSFTNVSTRTRSYYERLYLLSWDNGTITSNEILGSLDGYLQAATSPHRPNFSGENGAHAGPTTGGEVSDNGLTFQWTAPTTGTGIFVNNGTKYYKYRIVYYTLSGGQSRMSMVLYGIYNTPPETYVPDVNMAINDTYGLGNQFYWP